MKKLYRQALSLTLAGTILASCGISALAKEENPFSDVSETSWYYSSVVEAYDNGLMNGVGGGKFNPKGTLTREQFVTILANIAQADVSEYKGAASPFTDVSSTAWYAPYVLWAYDNGYASGYGNGKFGVGDAVTREQMAKFIINYCDANLLTLPNHTVATFTDEDTISSWAKLAVDECHAAGIFNGDDNGNMNPRNTAIRAEAAKVAVNLNDIVVELRENPRANDNWYIGDNYDSLLDDLKYMEEMGLLNPSNPNTGNNGDSEESGSNSGSDSSNTGSDNSNTGSENKDNSSSTTPETPSTNPSTDEDKTTTPDPEPSTSPDTNDSNTSENNQGTEPTDPSDKDTNTDTNTTDPSDKDDSTDVTEHEHEYAITGYELPDGSEMFTGGYTPFKITTNQNNTYLFVTGRDEDGNPIVERINPYVKYGTDYYACNVLDDDGNSAFAKGYECRVYTHADEETSTDYKVYFADHSWATPVGAVVAPSQLESGPAWDAHWNNADCICSESTTFKNTGSFKEYIYQIVKPVYDTHCSICGE